MLRPKVISLLPNEIVSKVADYLKATDINQFASTCSEFYLEFFVKVVAQKIKHHIENQENADIHYLQCRLERQAAFPTGLYSLQLLKFNITTKDQGWVHDSQSGSWVEAEFWGPQTPRIQGQGILERPFAKREPLVYNYQVREFQRKSKIFNKSDFSNWPTSVSVYLRSSGPGWKISCKQIEIQKFYSKGLSLNRKQFQGFVFRKRLSRKPTIRQ